VRWIRRGVRGFTHQKILNRAFSHWPAHAYAQRLHTRSSSSRRQRRSLELHFSDKLIREAFIDPRAASGGWSFDRFCEAVVSGQCDGNRTHDRRIRSSLLLPTELHNGKAARSRTLHLSMATTTSLISALSYQAACGCFPSRASETRSSATAPAGTVFTQALTCHPWYFRANSLITIAYQCNRECFGSLAASH
jgi:hypothetical protein